MPLFKPSVQFCLHLLLTVCAEASMIGKRQNCADHFTKCSPPGAAATSVPQIGNDLSPFYVDLLDSVSGITFKRRGIQPDLDELFSRDSVADVCCADGTSCLLLKNFKVPFCYDKFTTNFFLPTGDYGTLDTGTYTTTDGSKANLILGNYTLSNGTAGDLYGPPHFPSKPNTSTLAVPKPYTSAGVGSAIPVTALGGQATFTTTSPIVVGSSILPLATTQAATTVPESTLPVTTVPVTTLTLTSNVSIATSSSTSSAAAFAPLQKPDSYLGAGAFIVVFLFGV